MCQGYQLQNPHGAFREWNMFSKKHILGFEKLDVSNGTPFGASQIRNTISAPERHSHGSGDYAQRGTVPSGFRSCDIPNTYES